MSDIHNIHTTLHSEFTYVSFRAHELSLRDQNKRASSSHYIYIPCINTLRTLSSIHKSSITLGNIF